MEEAGSARWRSSGGARLMAAGQRRLRRRAERGSCRDDSSVAVATVEAAAQMAEAIDVDTRLGGHGEDPVNSRAGDRRRHRWRRLST
jgi:hypothetical protein